MGFEMSEQNIEKIEDEEDLFGPILPYVVKFDESDSAKGGYLFAVRGSPGVALRGDIFVVPEEDLALLDKAHLKYQSRELWTNDPQKIREYFGVK